jgi:hypothetical protein
MDTEPLIHSFNTDCLPDEHPWAHRTVICGLCGVMVHARNNKCMQEWVEWGGFAVCMCHAAAVFSAGVDFDRFKQLTILFTCISDGG